MPDITAYGGAKPHTIGHVDMLKLVSPIVNDDPIMLNAFRGVDRKDFLPGQFQDLAYQDRLLKIAYDEVSINPTLVAKKLFYLAPEYGKTYLHLGSGTGYMSNLISYIAGDTGKVYALERLMWFWEKSREYSAKYKSHTNLEFLYRDGTLGLETKAPYDGIMVSYIYEEIPEELLVQLKVGGKLVAPTGYHTLKIYEREGEEDFLLEEVPEINSYAFGNAKSGLA